MLWLDNFWTFPGLSRVILFFLFKTPLTKGLLFVRAGKSWRHLIWKKNPFIKLKTAVTDANHFIEGKRKNVMKLFRREQKVVIIDGRSIWVFECISGGRKRLGIIITSRLMSLYLSSSWSVVISTACALLSHFQIIHKSTFLPMSLALPPLFMTWQVPSDSLPEPNLLLFSYYPGPVE